MKFRKLPSVLFPLLLATCLLLFAGAAWASDEASHDDEAMLDDAALELKVKTALLTKIGWDMMDVDVEAQNGSVWLDGTTDNRSHQELAIEVARSVEGVEKVENRLRFESPEPEGESRTPVTDKVEKGMTQAESEVRDAILESRVKTALIDAIGTQAFDVEVEATDGEVSLRGTLEDSRHEELALDTTRECEGVENVIDLIEVG